MQPHEPASPDTRPDLPPATGRQLTHTRSTVTHGYLRDDGLWDLEGELRDVRTWDSANADGQRREPGDPIHWMRIRLTVDDQLHIHGAVAAMRNTPFDECAPAAAPFHRLVGQRIGPGWRRIVAEAMGGVQGCTHLRELLSAMATVAYQTVNPYRRAERRDRGEAVFAAAAEPSYQMGQCLAWDFDGPVIARVAPQFIGWGRKAG